MTIPANTPVTQSGYHYILDVLKTILSTESTGYGIVPVSDYIGTGTLIKPEAWQALYDDVNKVYQHQNGTASTVVSTETYPIAVGYPLKTEFVNELTSSIDTLAANKYTVHPSQLASYSTSSLATVVFTNSLTNIVDFSWPDERSIDWFFNLGGYITTDLDAPSSPDPEIEAVVNLIKSQRDNIRAPFNRDLWLATKEAPGRTYSVTANTVYTSGPNSGIFTVTNTYQLIDEVWANTSTIRVTTEVIPTDNPNLIPISPLDALVTVTNYESVEVIDAVTPVVSNTASTFSGAVSTRSRQTTSLSASPSSLYYNFTGGGSSTPQTVTITNNYTDQYSSTATITDIRIGNSVATPNLSSSSLPITIPVGGSTSFDLSWSKPTIVSRELGETSSPIVIKSNNTNGDLIIPTRVYINEPAGDWGFSPASVTRNLTSYKKLTETINIVTSFSRVRNVKSFTLAQTGNNFSLTKTPNAADPTAIISYEPFDTSTATFVATLTVTVETADTTGDYVDSTKVFTFTVNQALSDSNLGSWISPLGSVNSVIGASYDVIGGVRYLTLGVGVGANGAPTVDGGGGDPKYANLEYLGANSNSLVASNYSFEKYSALEPEYEKFGKFLREYGIKSTQLYIGPNDPECSFDFEAPESGNYKVDYSVYESGYVEIDGNKVINLSAYDVKNYQNTSTAVINLTAGTHKIRFVGNLRMAATISTTEGILIASTLNIIQITSPYRYWWEVYRFPINMDGQFKLMNSREYRVKDTATAVSVGGKKLFPYGNFFGYSATNLGNMFEVRSNGNGQVTITIVPPIQEGNIGDTVTVSSLYFAFYYKQFSVPRYTHKTGGRFDNDTTYTDFFVGFDKFGNVRTDKRLIPKEFDYGKKNGVIDKVVTFFLSNLITDYIILEVGLFKSWYLYTFNTGVEIVGVLYSQNISFGAYVLESLGVNIGASQTVSGYIINFFSSFFEGTAVAAQGATTVLSAVAPTVQAAGGVGAVNAQLAEKLLTGGLSDTIPAGAEFILDAKAAGVYDQVILGSAEYLGGAEVATANIAVETGAASEAAGASILSGEGAVILSNVAGVILTAVGIKLIADGLKDGDIASIAVGAAATYAGYVLAETLFTAALAAVCFSEDTMVEMADGSTKKIKEIQVGDLVKNASSTGDNQVTFIERHDGYLFPTLYSPDKSVKPFATPNHPLYIDGKLFAPSSSHYLWLDVKPLEKYHTELNLSPKVYNLWVTGDHTYKVNGFGTTAIIDGGALLNSLNQGIVKDAEVSSILADMVKDGPTSTYGAYLINRYLGKFDNILVTKPLVFFACGPSGSARRLTFKLASRIVGQVAKQINRK